MVFNARKLVKNQFCGNPPAKNVVSQTGWKNVVGSFSKQIEYEEVRNITDSLGHFGLQRPLRGTKPQICEEIVCLQKQNFPIWWRNCNQKSSTKLSSKNKTSRTTLQLFWFFQSILLLFEGTNFMRLQLEFFSTEFNVWTTRVFTLKLRSKNITNHTQNLWRQSKSRFFGKINIKGGFKGKRVWKKSYLQSNKRNQSYILVAAILANWVSVAKNERY